MTDLEPEDAVHVEEFVGRLRKLVSVERDAEIDEESVYKANFSLKQLEQKGICITRLLVSEHRTGLYGRCLLMLSDRRGNNFPLPQTSIRTRDIVEIKTIGTMGISVAEKEEPPLSGVVYRLTEHTITVSLEEVPSADLLHNATNIAVIKLANQVTYQRYMDALKSLAKFDSAEGGGVADRVLGVLYGGQVPRINESPLPWKPINGGLNAPQIDAVDNALSAIDVAAIHGPPGTGKTTVCVEFILQCVAQGNRILVCAPSNIAGTLRSVHRLAYDGNFL